MDSDFNLDYRYSVGNLHIDLTGAFSRRCAWVLFKTIKRQYAGSGRIFVNTRHIDRVGSAGAALFKDFMAQLTMTPDWLYFKGEKGFAIAPDGSRVITSPQNDRRRRGPRRSGLPMLRVCC